LRIRGSDLSAEVRAGSQGECEMKPRRLSYWILGFMMLALKAVFAGYASTLPIGCLW
jgi:hypothetical protein